MEKLAEEQGTKRVELNFATMDKKSLSSEMLNENLIAVNKLKGTFHSLQDYQVIQAAAASAAFKAKVQEEAKQKVDFHHGF